MEIPDDELSRDDLILKYTGTAVQWAKYWANKFQVRVEAGFGDEEDVCASSYFALCKAAEKWEPERSSFPTTLNWWVRAYVMKEVNTLSGKRGQHHFGKDYEEISPLSDLDDGCNPDLTGMELRVELERENPLYAEAFDLVCSGDSIWDAATTVGLEPHHLLQKFYTAVKYSGTMVLP